MSSPRFERNLGFLSTDEQNALEQATVAIAGAGGDGGMLAIQLARMGVQNFHLADPDPFEIENINRQAACTDKTIGINKAEAVAGYIQDVNPDANVRVFDDGITEENIEEFAHGATLLIDETEFTMHALGIMLAREARKNDQAVLTALNIGFGALVTTFSPRGKTLESVLGFGDEEPMDEIKEKEVGLDKWLPFLPNYIDLSAFAKVASGEKSAPSIAPGVAAAANLGATQAFLNIAGTGNKRPKPVYAPKAQVFDAMTGDSKEVKFGKVSHYKHLSRIAFRNLLKLNPQSSY